MRNHGFLLRDLFGFSLWHAEFC